MKTVSLLHPFSAKAIGLSEEDLFFSHSKPHEKALLQLQEEGYSVSIAYFTGNLFPFSKTVNDIKKVFWPISKPLFKKRHGWRKQHSLLHYASNKLKTPDVTIINMSGHGSPYCFKLAELLVEKNKPYIAMLGGLHISKDEKTMDYYRKAHHIIVHTEVQQRQLLSTPEFENLSIKVMPLGIDTNRFKPKPILKDGIELLFVGRISRLKQIELCLEVLGHLLKNQEKDAHLTIAGPVSDAAYHLELLTLCDNLNIKENVDFTGTIAQQGLVPYYQKADLLLLPSKHESFGMVMVEAMACGTPVAALEGAGGPDEIVEDGVNGILATKESFSVRILDYFKSDVQQQLFSKNSRKVTEEKWSLTQTISSLRTSIEAIFS